jgi:hypothetical protein
MRCLVSGRVGGGLGGHERDEWCGQGEEAGDGHDERRHPAAAKQDDLEAEHDQRPP